METTHATARTHTEEASDDLFDTEATGVKYVEQIIQRDTQVPPPRKVC